ncbi:hypothetical protein JCM3774_000531 [Rhodotorula dairenensis]
MDFQKAVFQALEDKKRADGEPLSTRVDDHSTVGGPTENGTSGTKANGHANGLTEPLTDSDRSSPSRPAQSSSSSSSAGPSMTPAAAAATAPANSTKQTGSTAPPHLQPINLGYMFSSPNGGGSVSRPGSRSTSEPRSPTLRRGTDQTDYSTMLPQIASHHLPPSSPTSPTSAAANLSGLGLDRPRPKARSQASYNWFDDAAGPLSPASQNRSTHSSRHRRDVSNSPARLDQAARAEPHRASSLGASHADGEAGPQSNGFSSPDSTSHSRQPSRTGHLSPGHANAAVLEEPPRRSDSPASMTSQEHRPDFRATTTDTGDKGEPGSQAAPQRPSNQTQWDSQRMDESPQATDSSELRGAFTTADLERGARRLRGEEPDAPVGQTAAGAGKDGTFKKKVGGTAAAAILRHPKRTLGPILTRSVSADGAEDSDGSRGKKGKKGMSGATGMAAGDSSLPASGTTTPARPRSLHNVGGEDGVDWADEERDQFDADGPPGHTGPPHAARRSSAFPFPSPGFASAFGSHNRTGQSESGASTPRNDRASLSEDEGAAAGGGLGAKRPAGHARRGSAWSAVRNKLLNEGRGAGKKRKEKQGASLTGHQLVAELATGALPLAIVKMGTMDRDDKGDKRIPVLMNYLKLKVTDSIYPLHDKHAVFRIELEYGDSAVKWVIYRELKDFVNLHAHYRVANLRQGIEKFPAFPKTSLPYLNWLKNEGKGHVKKAEFARLQREALENYLLKLIRATMFGPGANRLCKFLEISAMSIMLATRGGEQGKQGYLRVTSSGASRRRPPGFHPLSWKKRHDPKWFLVRDSYIVAVESPASTEVFDVVMVDSTFELERPARAYRKGLQMLHADNSHESLAMAGGTTGDLQPAKPSGYRGAGDPNDPSTTNAAEGQENQDDLRTTSAHTFYLRTSERKMRLVAKTERQQDQFIASIERMLAKTIWAGKNRFDSFAPIRLNVAAQWLIDGRDYFWSLSRAIALAKHKIFIHDWWLSPELYLRRPPAANEKWRLDRLLQRKAREGVEVYVIVYNEVSDGFTPVSSAYTKASLRALHPNIHVQRSPSHVATGTLLWSHHEKMCVIDETIGFMGGLDLCFGRWDTPGHVLVDDGPNYADSPDAKHLNREEVERGQIWPGKDYSNQRVLDFHTLQKPFEDMYDRSKVPRQPWHDIGLQIIGQPARDLCRHFIQRWNYLLRTKNHSIKMPFLVPAPDFTPEQLQELRITGTCEVQICRSVSPWSMGISHVEHSIQNAYIKAIQLSDHFVYIENQFFITSTEVEGTVVENKIGDALVSRIVRAHSEGTPWRAIVVIPMEPGYPYPLDHSDASSVRLIMECQFRSICRGEGSIFARLRHEGIDPDEYITFFGLRGWGTLSTGAFTTESTYIHAKSMIVDDRIAIIGSANINERSQRGDRDSELACVVRDTDMIDSTMGGQPYQVGRFAHTMRVRLMREHLGVNVDELEASEGREELEAREADEIKHRDEEWDPDHEQSHGTNRGVKGGRTSRFIRSVIGSGAGYVGATASGLGEAGAMGLEKTGRKIKNNVLPSNSDHQHDNKPEGLDSEKETKADKIAAGEEGSAGFASTVVPTIEEKVMAENRPAPGHREQEDIREANKSQPANVERESGPATHKPNQKREEEEEEQGNPGEQFPARKAAEESSNGHADAEHDQEGEMTSQHNTSADDTRKLMSDSDENGVATEAPLDGEPTDVTNANQGYHKLDTGGKSTASGTTLNGNADGKSTAPHRTTNKSEGNEKAASRNAVTSAIKRNLRERGPYTVPLAAPKVDPYGFADPLVDSFYKDVWLAAAARNTQVFRKVFRCMPDDLVQTWKQYREFQNWAERHNKAPKNVVPPGDDAPHTDPANHSGQHGAGGGGSGGGVMGQGQDESGQTMEKENRSRSRVDLATSEKSSVDEKHEVSTGLERSHHNGHVITRRARSNTQDLEALDGASLEGKKSGRGRSGTLFGGSGKDAGSGGANAGGSHPNGDGAAGPNSGSGTGQTGNEAHDHDEAFPEEERQQMKALLEEVTGQLVVFPTRFLEAESAGGNFLFSKDRIPPLAIYN